MFMFSNWPLIEVSELNFYLSLEHSSFIVSAFLIFDFRIINLNENLLFERYLEIQPIN